MRDCEVGTGRDLYMRPWSDDIAEGRIVPAFNFQCSTFELNMN